MDALGLQRWLVDLCHKMKMTKPFPVQTAVIPEVLAGKNVIASAPTGQGKTAAFVLPVIQQFLDADRPSWYAVMLAPTRELIAQLAEQVALFGSGVAVRFALVIGGEEACKQKVALTEKPCHFIMATPGRLADMIQSDPVFAKRFRRVKKLCLDECDKLLDVGLVPALKTVLDALQLTNMQRLSLSATLNDAVIEQLQSLLSLDPETTPVIRIAGEPEKLVHKKYICSPVPLYHLVHYLISGCSIREHTTKDMDDTYTGRGIIFTHSIKECEILAQALKKLKHTVVSLHSLHDQLARKRNYEQFKSEQARIMVATNVAARGLDLPKVDWVINLDVPSEFEDYAHRVGRCARAGKPGTALTFVTVSENKIRGLKRMKDIEKKLDAEVTAQFIDEEEAMLFPNRLNKAVAAARLELEKTEFVERLDRRRKQRRLEHS